MKFRFTSAIEMLPTSPPNQNPTKHLLESVNRVKGLSRNFDNKQCAELDRSSFRSFENQGVYYCKCAVLNVLKGLFSKRE